MRVCQFRHKPVNRSISLPCSAEGVEALQAEESKNTSASVSEYIRVKLSRALPYTCGKKNLCRWFALRLVIWCTTFRRRVLFDERKEK